VTLSGGPASNFVGLAFDPQAGARGDPSTPRLWIGPGGGAGSGTNGYHLCRAQYLDLDVWAEAMCKTSGNTSVGLFINVLDAIYTDPTTLAEQTLRERIGLGPTPDYVQIEFDYSSSAIPGQFCGSYFNLCGGDTVPALDMRIKGCGAFSGIYVDEGTAARFQGYMMLSAMFGDVVSRRYTGDSGATDIDTLIPWGEVAANPGLSVALQGARAFQSFIEDVSIGVTLWYRAAGYNALVAHPPSLTIADAGGGGIVRLK
jgi:hypothetical protein